MILYERAGAARARKGAGSKREYPLDDPELRALIEPDLWEQLQEDVELLQARAGL